MNPTLEYTLLSLLFFSGIAMADDIAVEGAYARAVPPGQPTSAAYLVMKNRSDSDRALVKVSSSVSKAAELHTHLREDGMMKMRRVDKIEVAKGGVIKLRPSGLHIMLIQLKKQLAPGDMVDLELEFDDGTRQVIQAPVKKITLEMLMEDIEETTRQQAE